MEQAEKRYFLAFHLTCGPALGLGTEKQGRQEIQGRESQGATEMSLILSLQAFKSRDCVHSEQLWVKTIFGSQKVFDFSAKIISNTSLTRNHLYHISRELS